MHLTRRWKFVTFIALLVKLVTIFLSPLAGTDFQNWVGGARQVYVELLVGHLPSISSYGAYTGMMTFLAFFYGIWHLLPIQHPSLHAMVDQPWTVSQISFMYVMKSPIIVADLAAGIMISRLVGQETKSEFKSEVAFMAWYLNPLILYWMYWFSTFDVVPIAIFLLGIVYVQAKRWVRSGTCIALAGLLRLFPFLVVPYFVLFAYRTSPRACGRMLVGFLVPVFLVAAEFVRVSGWTAVGTVLQLPTREPWIIDFYGFPILNGAIYLVPLVLGVELYAVWKLWKENRYSVVNALMFPLLLIFVVSYHRGYHFTWTLPFVCAYLALSGDFLLFALLISCGIVASRAVGGMVIVGDPYYQPTLTFLEALIGGALYGIEAVYVLKVNLESTFPTFMRAFSLPARFWVARTAAELELNRDFNCH